MRSVITFFIKYPILVTLGMVSFLFFGLAGFKSLNSSFFPEESVKFIFIETIYPGASPEEIEEGIILKIEDNLKGITDIDRVTSVSSENRGVVTIELENKPDIDKAFEDVKNAVDQISSFPVGMEPPIIYKQELVNFAANFAISGDVSLKELKKDKEHKVELELASLIMKARLYMDAGGNRQAASMLKKALKQKKFADTKMLETAQELFDEAVEKL